MDQFPTHTGEPEGDEPTSGRGARRRLWPVLYGLVAFGLWVQLLAPGALAESRSADGSGIVLAVYSLPVFAGAVGMLWRHPAGRLAAVPLSLVPGLALLPQAELQALSTPGALSLAMGTFALYLIVAAGRPTELPGDIGRPREPTERSSDDPFAPAFGRFVAVRFAAVGALFAVVTWALFWDPSIQEALAELGGRSEVRTQHLFATVTVYLGWMVVSYMGTVLPALNWEYHRRRSPMPDGQRALLSEPTRLGRRIVMWLGILMVAVAVALWRPW